MSSFEFCYLEACGALSVKPNEKILLNIQQAINSSSLNLSAVELTDDICKTIGLALTKDIFLLELDLSNSMLSDYGLSSILVGLEKNKHLRTLNLKGNNIRGFGTEAIGKFLRHNNYLENLYLEWNNTGIFPERFSYLCQGLISNNCLKSLDLRNNQLNHLCAQSISEVLYRNSTLQKLDLRWNAIGLIGGRSLLKALATNESILKLDISGNDLPLEIEKSIGLITAVSSEKYLINSESIQKTKAFASKLQELQIEQRQQLKSMMDQIDRKDKDCFLHQRWSAGRLNELQEALAEKDNIIVNLSKKLKETEKHISLVTDEKNCLALALNESEIKFKETKKEYLLLSDKERLERENVEGKLLEEIGSLKEENLLLKQQVQDYKVVNTNLEEQIMKLKSSLIKVEKMAKLEEQSFQERLSILNVKHQESLKENDRVRKNEVATLRDEISEVEKGLKSKIMVLESKRADLEKLLFDKESQIMESKIHADEMIEDFKKKMKEDEEKLKKQMGERIKVLESANKKQVELLKEHAQMMFDLETKCRENDLLLAEEAHRNQCLEKSFEAKNAEMETAIVKVKLEVKDQLEEFTKVKILLEDSNAEKATLRQKIEEIQNQHVEELKRKDQTMKSLKSEIIKQKRKVQDIFQNENKRIKDLQAAFATYVNSAEDEIGTGIQELESNIDS